MASLAYKRLFCTLGEYAVPLADSVDVGLFRTSREVTYRERLAQTVGSIQEHVGLVRSLQELMF